jgi:hypothetical protein
MKIDDAEITREAIRQSALDPASIAVRFSYAEFSANLLKYFGEKLFVCGHILGSDRRDGVSPFGHGDDSAVAVSMLLRIGSELVSGSADLMKSGRHYAGAALIRQLVEVEYLAWAFEEDNEQSRQWLRSTKSERKSFFTPAKLRQAANGRFRSADYGFHCELGGHPTPRSWRLLNDADATSQLMLSDCLGHSTKIWNHFLGWVESYNPTDTAFVEIVFGNDANAKVAEMYVRNQEWLRIDNLTALPPPPIEE